MQTETNIEWPQQSLVASKGNMKIKFYFVSDLTLLLFRPNKKGAYFWRPEAKTKKKSDFS